ncbi:hypothetical protein ACWDAZ_07685, partial [Streptomyces sp. NPDC001215]
MSADVRSAVVDEPSPILDQRPTVRGREPLPDRRDVVRVGPHGLGHVPQRLVEHLRLRRGPRVDDQLVDEFGVAGYGVLQPAHHVLQRGAPLPRAAQFVLDLTVADQGGERRARLGVPGGGGGDEERAQTRVAQPQRAVRVEGTGSGLGQQREQGRGGQPRLLKGVAPQPPLVLAALRRVLLARQVPQCPGAASACLDGQRVVGLGYGVRVVVGRLGRVGGGARVAPEACRPPDERFGQDAVAHGQLVRRFPGGQDRVQVFGGIDGESAEYGSRVHAQRRPQGQDARAALLPSGSRPVLAEPQPSAQFREDLLGSRRTVEEEAAERPLKGNGVLFVRLNVREFLHEGLDGLPDESWRKCPASAG